MTKIHIISQKPVLKTNAFDVVEYQIERNGEVHTHSNVHIRDDVFIVPINEKK